MLSFLPGPVLGPLTFLLFLLNTAFWLVPFYLITLAKILVPVPAWRTLCTRMLLRITELWSGGNDVVFRLTQRIHWDIQLPTSLRANGHYLLVCNHQSWVDIAALLRALNRRIPPMRFFLKRQLVWVPGLGPAWWALDYPFLHRHSKEYLKKHPEMRHRDFETTKKACERYRGHPVTIISFLEGTRFTTAKHRRQESPYRHLLRPKAGGIALVLGAMGEQLERLLDVTIVYPDGPVSFWRLFCGRVSRIIVRVKDMDIPQSMKGGDYPDDIEHRELFQSWVRELWQEKDHLIEGILHPATSSATS